IAGWNPHKSQAESLEIIRTVFSAPETYAVVLKETGEPVGSVGLKNAETDTPEVGYWIGVPYWGQGLIPEAVEKLVERAFLQLNSRGIWCGYYDDNHKSRRVQEKCGFIYHHTERDKRCDITGDIHDEHYSYLSRECWERRRKSTT
ncbi:MAG: GNAT family N-acetyltransferase, partial [Oscillospiraceae bacterium]|nr:GNAT family N-acetyltransferase [Oscillospiraceae bacterium]